MSAAAAALSLLGPAVVGWLLTQRMWPDVPGGLRLGLGASLGAGVAGTVYFFALLVSDSARASLAMSEIVLVGAIVVLLLRRRRVQRDIESEASSNRAYAWCAAITAIVAGAAFLFVLDLSRRGGFDALVMWNLRARLIAASKVSPLSSILDKALLGLHLDYPLLLPSLVSRGWQYARSDSSIVPAAIAALFTIATIVISVGGIRVLRTDSQGWIAASILLGTPLLLGQGASQYADIVMCCFITAAVTLFCVYDFDPARSGLPVLAGIAAAAAACTKNEGILFLVVLSAARLAAVVLRRSIPGAWRELVGFSGGAFFGVLTLAVFKLWYSPPNEISALSVQAVWTRLTDANLNFEIVRGIRDSLNFGQWRLNPMPWMALHAAVTWSPAAPSNSKKVASWFTAAFVLTGMLCGFHIVYLVSPYDTEYYVQSSFNRLMLQLWPCAIIFYSLMAAPRSALSRAAAFRAVGVLIVIASIVAWSQMDRQLRVVAGSKPRIELSKTEVTAGDSYVIKITGIAGPEVYITYSLDGKPMGQFNAYLGRDGSVKFPVSQSTPKGVYRFLAVRTSDNPVWTPFANDAAIVKK